MPGNAVELKAMTTNFKPDLVQYGVCARSASGNSGYVVHDIRLLFGNAPELDAKLGVQIPMVKEGCHNWANIWSWNIYGEGKGSCFITKNKADNAMPKDSHLFMADGGGGVELVYDDHNIFEASIGGKAGYRYDGAFSYNKDDKKFYDTGSGRAYAGPTASMKFKIPCRPQVYFGVKGELQFPIQKNAKDNKPLSIVEATVGLDF